MQQVPYPGPHGTLTTLSFLLSSRAQPALSSFPAQHRVELANNKEMAGRRRSYSKVPLKIQGMRFTAEERKKEKVIQDHAISPDLSLSLSLPTQTCGHDLGCAGHSLCLSGNRKARFAPVPVYHRLDSGPQQLLPVWLRHPVLPALAV